MEQTDLYQQAYHVLNVKAEDSCFCDARQGMRFRFSILADGRSGDKDTKKDAGGAYASRQAVFSLADYLTKTLQHDEPQEITGTEIKSLIKHHTDELDKKLQGTRGTTLDVVVIDTGCQKAYAFHIGDGAVYVRKKDKSFHALTTPKVDPQSGSPLGYLGKPGGYGEPEFKEISTADVSQILMVTDGITDVIPEEQLNGALAVDYLGTLGTELETLIHNNHITAHQLENMPGFSHLFERVGREYGNVAVQGRGTAQIAQSILNYIDPQNDDAPAEKKASIALLRAEIYSKLEQTLKEQLDDATAVLIDFTGNPHKIQERITELENKDAATGTELKRAEADLETATRTIAEKEAAISRLNSIINRFQADAEAKQEEYAQRKQEYENTIAQKDTVIAERDAEADKLKTGFARAWAEYSFLQHEAEQLKTGMQVALSEKERLRVGLRKTAKKYASTHKLLEKTKSRVSELETCVREADEKIRTLKDDIDKEKYYVRIFDVALDELSEMFSVYQSAVQTLYESLRTKIFDVVLPDNQLPERVYSEDGKIPRTIYDIVSNAEPVITAAKEAMEAVEAIAPSLFDIRQNLGLERIEAKTIQAHPVLYVTQTVEPLVAIVSSYIRLTDIVIDLLNKTGTAQKKLTNTDFEQDHIGTFEELLLNLTEQSRYISGILKGVCDLYNASIDNEVRKDKCTAVEATGLLSKVRSYLEWATGEIDSQEGSIRRLNADITIRDSQISGLQGSVDTLKSQLSGYQSKEIERAREEGAELQELRGKLNDAQSSIRELSEQVDGLSQDTLRDQFATLAEAVSGEDAPSDTKKKRGWF